MGKTVLVFKGTEMSGIMDLSPIMDFVIKSEIELLSTSSENCSDNNLLFSSNESPY